MPRLELTAITISVYLENLIKEELQIDFLKQSLLWTDSTTVLRYLNNTESAFHTFVANRVQTIKDNTEISQWRYVPSKLSPAAYVSRGLTVAKFLRCECWKQGPEFLWRSESASPEQPQLSCHDLCKDSKIKKSKVHCSAIRGEESHFM